MIRANRYSRHAAARIDMAHAAAATKPDPVAHMRSFLAETERTYADTGSKLHLEILHQLESLDNRQQP